MWDRTMPGASAWYAPQDQAHVGRIREQLPADTHGVRVLCGCESEYGGAGKVGISREVASQLDFVLMPMSHLHMKGYVEPLGLTSLEQVAALMVARFRELLALGLATGIAHPFLPCGYGDQTDAVLACISDAELRACFDLAAAAGVSIEITIGFFPGCRGGETPGFHDETFLRVLRLAKACGCVFHFASDTHALSGLGSVRSLQPYVDALGLRPGDLHPLVRSGRERARGRPRRAGASS
jgi:histidinol phosphatase-like PHP family hydrolase